MTSAPGRAGGWVGLGGGSGAIEVPVRFARVVVGAVVVFVVRVRGVVVLVVTAASGQTRDHDESGGGARREPSGLHANLQVNV